jgi:2-dehydro-3-deoxyphosphogluconate aldolase/(4S)-4-hydroxy-2-oxoglutarate aldolase
VTGPDIGAVMRAGAVMPVLVLEDAGLARVTAEALVAGGLCALEVTLRTPAALDAIRAMSSVKGAIVGAGTVRSARDLGAAREAGAQFIVSPGLTDALATAARDVAFLPGVATASDIMRGLDHGLAHFKFFPAEANGGVAALKALSGPFADVRFCPTGGVTPANARDWLALPQVQCVGGTWLSPKGAFDLAALTEVAREAAALR